jgi:phosphate starvation-inducible protein PhoH
LELKSVVPKTKNQTLAFEAYEDGYNLMLHGVAGTGKTFIATYLALCTIMDETNGIDKMAIVRSAVPTRDIGFLPGTAKDKMEVYEAPYQSIFGELFGNDGAYSLLKLKNVVDFVPTSFIRGMTLDNMVIIVEEAQNMTDAELNTIITRLGKNTRLILCGDHRQNDLLGKRGADASGIEGIFKVFSYMKSIAQVEFGIDDVQRSAFVKEYLKARLTLGLDKPMEL